MAATVTSEQQSHMDQVTAKERTIQRTIRQAVSTARQAGFAARGSTGSTSSRTANRTTTHSAASQIIPVRVPLLHYIIYTSLPLFNHWHLGFSKIVVRLTPDCYHLLLELSSYESICSNSLII